MRFSDLNSRARKEEASASALKAGRLTPLEPKKKPAAPVNPLDAPIADFPLEPPIPSPELKQPAVPEPVAGSAVGLERGQTPEPPLSRKNQQRKDEAAMRAAERPFRELDAQARGIYARNISLTKELLNQADQAYLEKYERVLRLAELNSQALLENPALLNYTYYATADNYLCAHSANVALISQAMGLALGLEKREVNFLGFCAMAHDLGMTDYAELARKEGPLTDAEYSEVMLHSAAGAAKIDRFIDMDYKLKDRAKKVIGQVHERIDGLGYPGGLMNEEIDPLAQIIGIADVYEAMSHPRPWRPAGHPHNAIKHLIDKEGKGFNAKTVKSALEVLSIYPPGSLVALSTGEIAAVARINKGSLTRPVVEVLLGADFSPAPARMVDLMEHPLTAVERIVEEEELTACNPKFSAKRELSRWWVDW
jgi:HD-GYP domain-containing protein (c-di-GMP phosphodiesterase class II)